MASYQAPTTLVEAINAMMASIGEAPVISVDGSTPLPVDVELAMNTLLSVSREIQSRGWAFNQEYCYPLFRSGDGTIPVPNNAMFVDPDGNFAQRDGVLRGLRLYDRANHTFVWDVDPTVTIKLLLDFTDLPESVRNYVVIRATRRFQAGSVGSPTLNSFTKEDEEFALALLQYEESDAQNCNVFGDNAEMFNAYILRGGGQRPY